MASLKPVILAVDDEDIVRSAVERDLKSRYGKDYRVLSYSEGEKALEDLRTLKARNADVAVLLADQRMPGMTGVEMLIEAREIFPEARRALLTAYADTNAAISAINEAGLDYYLQKPWDPPEERLFPVVDELLAQWQPPPRLADTRVVGHRWSRATHELRQFLSRNLVHHAALEVDSDEARQLLESAGLDSTALPVIFFGDGSHVVQPQLEDVAERVGLHSRPSLEVYDLVVVGAGPAGLAAGVYGASEGLQTLVVERAAPGGQAGTSSLIKNYLGFPLGLSGADLAGRAQRQALNFRAEILTPREVVGLELEAGYPVVCFPDGTRTAGRALIVATGVSYRTLDIPGAEPLQGAGIYYSATATEAETVTDRPVYIVGGGNSAGQAALFLAQTADSVSICIRREDLTTTMSRYLIDQIEDTANIEVRPRTEVIEARGDEHLEGLTLEGPKGTEEVDAAGLFVFIGMMPRTDWVTESVERDAKGFLLTGSDLGAEPRGWRLARKPSPLETSVPGIFAVGDVRSGSIKRVASAVGEGSMAVRFVHEHLAGA
jgi:thioredoxin reductase (NADPH)